MDFEKNGSYDRLNFLCPSKFQRIILFELLLTHKRGATSFQSLRTHNGVIYPAYQSICHALGLLGDDQEWNEAILEASFWSTSSQIRHLFVIILTFCGVNNPLKFLQNHWNLMTDNILYRVRRMFNNSNFQIPETELYNYVLYELQKLLNLNSLTLANFNLPLPKGSLINDLNNNLLIEEQNYDIKKLKSDTEFLIKNLNNEQLYIYQEILETINLGRNNLFLSSIMEEQEKHIYGIQLLAK